MIFDINTYPTLIFPQVNGENSFLHEKNGNKLNKDYIGNSNKFESDSSSISITSEKGDIKSEGRLPFKLFNSSNMSRVLDNETLKKRKRYIKNNKFVYVHPGSAAAKKMEMEKVRN